MVRDIWIAWNIDRDVVSSVFDYNVPTPTTIAIETASEDFVAGLYKTHMEAAWMFRGMEAKSAERDRLYQKRFQTESGQCECLGISI